MMRRERKSREEEQAAATAARLEAWVPKTKAGRLVMNGEVTGLDQIYDRNLPVLEPEIIDKLFPEISSEVLDMKTVRRTTDSGRKNTFFVAAVAGNRNGYVGVGIGKAPNNQPAIARAIQHAKMNLAAVRRACGSWECGCGQPHSVPFKVTGRAGSVRITLIPAPKGTGLAVGGTAKKVLELAGLTDVWSITKGDTRTIFNFAFATLDALKKTRSTRIEMLPPAVTGEAK
jgi:small subunit ribosomal protein S5